MTAQTGLTRHSRSWEQAQRAAGALAVLLAATLIWTVQADARGTQLWFTAWGTSAHSLAPATITVSDATVRMIVRSGVTGNALQVKIENTLGAPRCKSMRPPSPCVMRVRRLCRDRTMS